MARKTTLDDGRIVELEKKDAFCRNGVLVNTYRMYKNLDDGTTYNFAPLYGRTLKEALARFYGDEEEQLL